MNQDERRCGRLVDHVRRYPLVTLICDGDVELAASATDLVDQLGHALPEGVCWVDLRSVSAAAVAERVAVAVGAPTTPRHTAEVGLVGHLRDRRLFSGVVRT